MLGTAKILSKRLQVAIFNSCAHTNTRGIMLLLERLPDIHTHDTSTFEKKNYPRVTYHFSYMNSANVNWLKF